MRHDWWNQFYHQLFCMNLCNKLQQYLFLLFCSFLVRLTFFFVAILLMWNTNSGVQIQTQESLEKQQWKHILCVLSKIPVQLWRWDNSFRQISIRIPAWTPKCHPWCSQCSRIVSGSPKTLKAEAPGIPNDKIGQPRNKIRIY